MWEYTVLVAIIGIIHAYQLLELHFVGDALNWWRGDAVRLIYSSKSTGVSQLLSKCEILSKRYCPTPWLASPHLQTLFLHFSGRSPRVEYERQLYVTPDGGTIALDWVQPRQNSNFDETPTVCIVPGLTSDSNNHYVKHLARSFSDQSWRVLVINHRGLGGVSITSDYFYNAGWTEDLRRIIPRMQQKYPKSPLLAIGTSIGANILIKYLGEEGTKTPIRGAVEIGCPWDLVLCDRFISRRWVQACYDKVLANGLCQYAHLHLTALARMMDSNLLSKIPQLRTVRDFDNHCTRHVGKYETVDTYYRNCGSSQFLEGVAVTLLCISAEDDPICTKEAIPYDECRVNPNIILAVTKHGGHLGYFDGLGAKTIWYVRAATEFSKVLLSSSLMHQQSKGTAPATTRVDQGPFLELDEDKTVGYLGSKLREARNLYLPQLHKASSIEESRKDVGSGNVEHPSPSRTFTISPISQGGCVGTPKDLSNKGKTTAKEIIHSKKTAVKDASISAQANHVNNDLASNLASHNRRTVLLLAYIAIMTTVPFLGSAFSWILQVLARQWGKFNKA